ncbi:MAG: GGDEF domain-containing protein [Brachymonas sp.]|nr:GGDEF domain-containing protein [Brachymonas sp.]
MSLSMAVVLWWVVLAAKQSNRLAIVWIVAYVPLFLTIFWGLLEGLGLLAKYGLNYQLPIFATGIQVVSLGLALQWFARERHADMERLKALASTDPLTGFATVASFAQRLRTSWADVQTKQDLAVVYIELQSNIRDNKHLEHMLRRSVRVLRAATRSQDTVARLDGRLLALLMPGLHMGEDLSQRLSRIVALGSCREHCRKFGIAAVSYRLHHAPPLS